MHVRDYVKEGLKKRVAAVIAVFNADHDQKSHGARKGIPRIPPPPPGRRGGSGSRSGSGSYSNEEIKNAIQGREDSRRGSSAEGTTYRIAERVPRVKNFNADKAEWVDGLSPGDEQQRRRTGKPRVTRVSDGKLLEPSFVSKREQIEAKKRGEKQRLRTNHLTERLLEGGVKEIVDSVGGMEGILRGRPLWVEKRPTGDGENYIMPVKGTKKIVLNVTLQKYPDGFAVKTVMPEPPDAGGVSRRQLRGVVNEVKRDLGIKSQYRVEG